jgi:hypothetical protein
MEIKKKTRSFIVNVKSKATWSPNLLMVEIILACDCNMKLTYMGVKSAPLLLYFPSLLAMKFFNKHMILLSKSSS